MPTPDRPQRPEILPEVKHIVAVSSGKGGVGKTTVSVNLAVSLAKQGAAVGLLDADIYGPNVPIMMGSMAQPRSIGQKILPLENHNVKFMSLGLIAGENAPIIWRGPIVGRMIQQFLVDVIWGALDYLVVDLPPRHRRRTTHPCPNRATQRCGHCHHTAKCRFGRRASRH